MPVLSGPTGYEYDVFISYKHGSLYGAWVEHTFLPLFQELLKEELHRKASIFFDRTGISPTDVFPPRLMRALVTSRCMVAFWTPSYFYESNWCRTELTLMITREKRFGYGTVKNPGGLIAPITLHDGESFPKAVRERNPVDWSSFAYDGDGFKQTVEYIRFQQALKAWVPRVAVLTTSAPPWRKRWLSEPQPTGEILQRELGKLSILCPAPILK